MTDTTTQATATTSAAAMVTATASCRLVALSVINYSGGDETISVFRVPSGGSAGTDNALYYERSVPAGQTIQLVAGANAALAAGDALHIQGSAGSALVVTATTWGGPGGYSEATELTTSAAAVNTSGASPRVIRQISVANVTGTDRTVSIHFGGTADANLIAEDVTVPANESIVVNPALNIAIPASGSLYATASAASALTLTLTTAAR